MTGSHSITRQVRQRSIQRVVDALGAEIAPHCEYVTIAHDDVSVTVAVHKNAMSLLELVDFPVIEAQISAALDRVISRYTVDSEAPE